MNVSFKRLHEKIEKANVDRALYVALPENVYISENIYVFIYLFFF
jgi:hypothetical protein